MNDTLVAGRYRLGRRIGTGGMGRVWLARDEVLRRSVAVKEVLLPEAPSEDEAYELRMRTLREARAAARLSHPNVVRIYDVMYADDRPWIVMEYIPSRSLAQVIKVDGPLPPDQVAKVGIAVLDALLAAHAAGVLHRDVKPGNVLLADHGRVVLTDFGLATFDEIGSNLTQSGRPALVDDGQAVTVISPTGRNARKPPIDKKSVLAQLEHAQKNWLLVQIRRWIPGADRVEGFVVGVGARWEVLQRLSDRIAFDGWVLLRLKDVQAVSLSTDRDCSRSRR